MNSYFDSFQKRLVNSSFYNGNYNNFYNDNYNNFYNDNYYNDNFYNDNFYNDNFYNDNFYRQKNKYLNRQINSYHNLNDLPFHRYYKSQNYSNGQPSNQKADAEVSTKVKINGTVEDETEMQIDQEVIDIDSEICANEQILQNAQEIEVPTYEPINERADGPEIVVTDTNSIEGYQMISAVEYAFVAPGMNDAFEEEIARNKAQELTNALEFEKQMQHSSSNVDK